MDTKISLLFLVSLACASGEPVDQANALLLTTLDSVCLIYPKEMNYENDFLHIIFKLALNKSTHRIEDAVYDNKTWSIFFTLSNTRGGSQLVRLKRKTNFATNRSSLMEHFDFSYNIASNWVINRVYQSNYSKILSLDINPHKRKLYWIAFNTQTYNWYFTVGRLSSSYFTSKYLHQILIPNQVSFSSDGYSFISVIRDNYMNDISFFISNNQSLNLCHLINMTCVDYFRASLESTRTRQTTTSDYNSYRFIDLFDQDYYDMDMDKTTNAPSTSFVDDLYEQVFRYGKLMGIKYDPESNSMYLSDYLNDRIDRVSFADDAFKLKNIETILKSEFLSNSVNHVAVNPIMSFLFDNFVYWIDYEEGLKTSLLKSTCFRSIYKVKNAVSMKLITLKLNFNYDLKIKNDVLSKYINNLIGINGNDIIGLKTVSSKFKYPPDYVYYYSYVLNQNGSSKFFEFDFDKNFSHNVKFKFYFIFCLVLFYFRDF